MSRRRHTHTRRRSPRRAGEERGCSRRDTVARESQRERTSASCAPSLPPSIPLSLPPSHEGERLDAVVPRPARIASIALRDSPRSSKGEGRIQVTRSRNFHPSAQKDSTDSLAREARSVHSATVSRERLGDRERAIAIGRSIPAVPRRCRSSASQARDTKSQSQCLKCNKANLYLKKKKKREKLSLTRARLPFAAGRELSPARQVVTMCCLAEPKLDSAPGRQRTGSWARGSFAGGNSQRRPRRVARRH